MFTILYWICIKRTAWQIYFTWLCYIVIALFVGVVGPKREKEKKYRKIIDFCHSMKLNGNKSNNTGQQQQQNDKEKKSNWISYPIEDRKTIAWITWNKKCVGKKWRKKLRKARNCCIRVAYKMKRKKKFEMGKMSILQYKYEIMTLFMY